MRRPVTIKPPAGTVHQQDQQGEVATSSCYICKQWKNEAAESGGTCECIFPHYYGLVHRR